MITVLMPIYNGIEFIDESVGSILDQTFQEWELLIGINGHPANSPVLKLAQKYEMMDPRIRVFDFPELQGKATTLNALIPLSKYPYIALLDVDDLWHPQKLQVQHTFLEEFDVVGSQCIYFGDRQGSPAIPIGDITGHDFRRGNPVINSSAVLKKELASWIENGIEDYELWLRLWSQGKRFMNVNAILVKHRIHSASAFNSKGHAEKLASLVQTQKEN